MVTTAGLGVKAIVSRSLLGAGMLHGPLKIINDESIISSSTPPRCDTTVVDWRTTCTSIAASRWSNQRLIEIELKGACDGVSIE